MTRPLERRPGRVLVVLAGLPGAGKTTLLRRLAADPHIRALDAEDVAGRLVSLPLPYRALRPFVHALHLLHVLAAAVVGAPDLVTTDPMTSAPRRVYFRTVAALTGRRLHVVLVHAEPPQARDGQRRRGRVLSERRMSRHERRYRRTWARPGRDVLVVSRSRAERVNSLHALLVVMPPAETSGPSPFEAQGVAA